MVKTPLFIAKRYLFAKKSTQAINIIAWVSLLGFAVGVFAMIVVLSTMNGFEKLVFSMYNDFSPDIHISPSQGKVMERDSLLESYLHEENLSFSKTLEENAAFYYADFQHIARVKGVEPIYLQNANLEKHLVDGEMAPLDKNDTTSAIIGLGVDYKLATRVGDPNCLIEVNAPKRGDYALQSLESIKQEILRPVGVFAYDDAINNKYVLVSLAFAQKLFDRPDKFSAYEVYKVKNEENLQLELQHRFGDKYQVKTRYQMHEGLFKMFKTEKWFTFTILVFVLLLVSFNLVGSLSLLVIEKKSDIKTFKSIGMTAKDVRRIFFLEGVFIALIGSISGLCLGLVFCFAQIKYGFIKISGAIVESYPMQVKGVDVLLCLILVITIGILASVYPAIKAGRYHD